MGTYYVGPLTRYCAHRLDAKSCLVKPELSGCHQTGMGPTQDVNRSSLG